LARYVEITKLREEEIAKLIELLYNRSKGFEDPKLILIGGYGLRAFIPFARSTRDCDFVVKKDKGWQLDEIKKWFSGEISIETIEKKDGLGFMRCIKLAKVGGKRMRVSLDIMEGEVTGREEKEVVIIDEMFVSGSSKTKISIADKGIDVRVPSYLDYFILKVVSARPSDVRDIATLVWRNGMPKGMKRRVGQLMPYPDLFGKKIESLLSIIEDKRFLHSWRGTFMTTDFNEDAKKSVIEELSKL